MAFRARSENSEKSQVIQLKYLVSKRPRWTWDIIPTNAEYFKLFQLSPGLLLGGFMSFFTLLNQKNTHYLSGFMNIRFFS
jgi:hypothetical protein